MEYYRTSKNISMIELFDGRLDQFEVKEHVKLGQTSDNDRCLTDGQNYLWVIGGEDPDTPVIRRSGGNATGNIFWAIIEVFDTDIISEYEPLFWGFETWEEYDRALEPIHAEHEAELHTQI